MYLCLAPEFNERRYIYFNGTFEGKECKPDNFVYLPSRNTSTTECKICICFCDDLNQDTHRVVSLRAQVANTAENEVITSIQLNNPVASILSLFIEVGKLLPNGSIDASTLRWVDNPMPDVEYAHLHTDDYHILIRSNSRIDLDVITVNDNELLTGNYIISI